MCGICGWFNFNSGAPVNAGDIEQMTASITHRGPDDSGILLSGDLGLGFRRLSIIDLSSRGHQPMSDSSKTIWVVFNGEIYNFPELRRELQSCGHQFRSKSDTEVIVHGYQQWGKNVLDHLDGMFGLAVWDERKRQLMIARDRTGIKPVYYELNGDGVRFASEMRALLSVMKHIPDIDPEGLSSFLRYRYTPSPHTLLKNIKKLAPGSRLLATPEGCMVERWWKFEPEPFDPMPSVKQATDDLLDLYKQSVQRHLLSDVPVGLLLSGGLDSGLLLGLMQLHGDNWRTYTVGFGDQFKDDELAAAAETARIYNAPNHAVLLDRQTFCETLPHVVSLLEEPVASPSVIGMYHVCRRAREDVKVVLMGQGPDELFGGYRRHLGVQYGALWRALPGFLQNSIMYNLRHFSKAEAFERAFYSLGETNRMRRYQQIFSIVSEDILGQILRRDIYSGTTLREIPASWQALQPLMRKTDELGAFQFLELRSSLPDELLMYGDKLSMANSLEARLPYLDGAAVAYIERLSAGFKVRWGSRKWLHRRVCRKFLPPEVVKRRKLGFAAPVDEWFRSSLKDKFQDYLLDESSLIFDFIEPLSVRGLIEEHQNQTADRHKLLYSLVSLEEWMRQLRSQRLQVQDFDQHTGVIR